MTDDGLSLETTAEERSSWLRDTQPYGSPEGWWLGRLLRDFDRHAARIAELEAEIERQAERQVERIKAAVLAERAACEQIAATWSEPRSGRHDRLTSDQIADAIRARPTP